MSESKMLRFKLINGGPKEPEPPKVEPELVQMIEELLAQVKEGRTTGVVAIAFNNDRSYDEIVGGSVYDDFVATLGALELMKATLIRETAADEVPDQ